MTQLLTEGIGHPHVEKLVANMTMLFRLSDNKGDFWRQYERAMGKPVQLELLERDDLTQRPTAISSSKRN
jgi:hypothetical protein